MDIVRTDECFESWAQKEADRLLLPRQLEVTVELRCGGVVCVCVCIHNYTHKG